MTARVDLTLIEKYLFLSLFLLIISANRRLSTAVLNHLFVSFLFVFQNDNDLIDNDNAGQSPAAQAVVLTFTLTYYLLHTISSYVLLYVYVTILTHRHIFTHTHAHINTHITFLVFRARTAKVLARLLLFIP